jgi:hypothetical protein
VNEIVHRALRSHEAESVSLLARELDGSRLHALQVSPGTGDGCDTGAVEQYAASSSLGCGFTD